MKNSGFFVPELPASEEACDSTGNPSEKPEDLFAGPPPDSLTSESDFFDAMSINRKYFAERVGPKSLKNPKSRRLCTRQNLIMELGQNLNGAYLPQNAYVLERASTRMWQAFEEVMQSAPVPPVEENLRLDPEDFRYQDVHSSSKQFMNCWSQATQNLTENLNQSCSLEEKNESSVGGTKLVSLSSRGAKKFFTPNANGNNFEKMDCKSITSDQDKYAPLSFPNMFRASMAQISVVRAQAALEGQMFDSHFDPASDNDKCSKKAKHGIAKAGPKKSRGRQTKSASVSAHQTPKGVPLSGMPPHTSAAQTFERDNFADEAEKHRANEAAYGNKLAALAEDYAMSGAAGMLKATTIICRKSNGILQNIWWMVTSSTDFSVHGIRLKHMRDVAARSDNEVVLQMMMCADDVTSPIDCPGSKLWVHISEPEPTRMGMQFHVEKDGEPLYQWLLRKGVSLPLLHRVAVAVQKPDLVSMRLQPVALAKALLDWPESSLRKLDGAYLKQASRTRGVRTGFDCDEEFDGTYAPFSYLGEKWVENVSSVLDTIERSEFHQHAKQASATKQKAAAAGRNSDDEELQNLRPGAGQHLERANPLEMFQKVYVYGNAEGCFYTAMVFKFEEPDSRFYREMFRWGVLASQEQALANALEWTELKKKEFNYPEIEIDEYGTAKMLPRQKDTIGEPAVLPKLRSDVNQAPRRARLAVPKKEGGATTQHAPIPAHMTVSISQTAKKRNVPTPRDPRFEQMEQFSLQSVAEKQSRKLDFDKGPGSPHGSDAPESQQALSVDEDASSEIGPPDTPRPPTNRKKLKPKAKLRGPKKKSETKS